MVEDTKKSKLIKLFNTLKEDDRDIVIKIAESLVERCKCGMTNKASDNAEEFYGNEHHIM